MKAWITTTVLALAALLPRVADGESLFLEVTPTSLKQPPYVFEVAATPKGETIEFRIQVTAKEADLKHTSTSLGFHREVHNDDRFEITSGGHREVEAQRTGNALVCEFTVKAAEVNDPAFVFFFTKSIVRVRADGREMRMPSADYYWLPLKKFVKP